MSREGILGVSCHQWTKDKKGPGPEFCILGDPDLAEALPV